MPAGPFVIFIMMTLCSFYGASLPCSDREHSPLCFCQSTYRNSVFTDIFLAKLSLSQCATLYSSRQCRQGRFFPSSTHVTQLIPNLVNHTRCLEDTQCLHNLRNTQRCHRCQIISSSLLPENTSYVISTTTNNLPTDSCFYICAHDKSCGFLCFDRRITITVNCDICRQRRRNVTCRCIKVKQTETCVQSTSETATQRWMQKRGFPAAGILALLVFVTILLIIVIKLINRQIDLIARRKNGTCRRSITTITTYRSRQPSPSTAISYPNTPLLPSIQLRQDIVTANTMVELLNSKSQEYVVDIHRRDDEDELSVFLLENTTELNLKSKQIVDEDDELVEEDEEEEDQT